MRGPYTSIAGDYRSVICDTYNRAGVSQERRKNMGEM
eukprot:COSAG05_NODE_2631_length_2821_cov_3.459589_1_plen_36_part_10